MKILKNMYTYYILYNLTNNNDFSCNIMGGDYPHTGGYCTLWIKTDE